MKRNTMKSCSRSLVAAAALSLSWGAALAHGLPVVGNLGGLSNSPLGNPLLNGGINSSTANMGALSRGLAPLNGTLNPLLQSLANGARPAGGNNAALQAPGQRALPGLDSVRELPSGDGGANRLSGLSGASHDSRGGTSVDNATNAGAARLGAEAQDAQRRLESAARQSEFNRSSLLGIDLGRLDYDLGSATLAVNQGRGSLGARRIGDALESGRDAVGDSDRFTQDIHRNADVQGEADGSASGEGSMQGVGSLVGSGAGRVTGQGSSTGSLSGSGSGSGAASGNVIGGNGRAPDVVGSTTPAASAANDLNGTPSVGNNMPVVPAK